MTPHADQLAARLRAQARPILDRRLEHLDGELGLSDLAAILAVDLASRDTAALLVDRQGRVLAAEDAGDGPPAAVLDAPRYARALAGDPHATYLAPGPNGRRVLHVLIPPRAWLPAPRAIVHLATFADEASRPPPAVPIAEAPRPASTPPAAVGEALARVEAAFVARTASEERMRRFVADASHELRTPLTAIGAAADVLAAGAADDPARARALAAIVRRQADAMGRLVEDLLLLARADAGDTLLRRAPTDLAALVREHADELATTTGAAVTATAPESLVADVDGDRVRQILRNLTANALRHGTAVDLALTADDASVRLTVTDDGPGIAAAERERVFARFHRGGIGAGAGLGLAIVRELARAHGGDARATARGDGASGARVEVTLARVSGPSGECQ